MRLAALILTLVLGLSGCDRLGLQAGERQQQQQERRPAQVETVQPGVAPGTTPMNQRVAVLGFLNKRNGIARDLTLRPGQAVRIKDAIVRLRACETTPPWEFDKLTGAFVQMDVQQPEGGWRRVFSGWLYKESPSLNVVEHPVYDVWPKSCTMSFPDAVGSPDAPEDSNSTSSAPNSPAPAATAADSNVT